MQRISMLFLGLSAPLLVSAAVPLDLSLAPVAPFADNEISKTADILLPNRPVGYDYLQSFRFSATFPNTPSNSFTIFFLSLDGCSDLSIALNRGHWEPSSDDVDSLARDPDTVAAGPVDLRIDLAALASDTGSHAAVTANGVPVPFLANYLTADANPARWAQVRVTSRGLAVHAIDARAETGVCGFKVIVR